MQPLHLVRPNLPELQDRFEPPARISVLATQGFVAFAGSPGLGIEARSLSMNPQHKEAAGGFSSNDRPTSAECQN